MYTLLEIKDIRKKYKLNENGDIEPNGKEKLKAPSEMTAEEKSYIESALFLFRQVRNRPRDNHPLSALSDEEFLKQIQAEFIAEALNSNEYTIGIGAKDGNKKTQKPSYAIWQPLIEEKAGSMAYFMRILAENGKRLQMLQRSTPGALSSAIKYDLLDDKRSKFLQSLNPNSPLYTPAPKTKSLTQEQQQRRRAFVDKIMQVYKQCETDENYLTRAKNEERDMRLVVDFVETYSKGRIEMLSQNAIASVMNLLYAAQNISLDGQKDYVSILIDQPIISDFLRKMRDDNVLEKMAQKAQERKANGTLSEHKPTYWETAKRDANAIISEHPNAVEVVRKKLSESRTFTIPKGDIKNLGRAKLISVFAMTQGLDITRTTDSQGNRILQLGNGRAPSGRRESLNIGLKIF